MLGGVDVQQVVGLVEGQPFVPKATSRVVGFSRTNISIGHINIAF